MMVADILRSKGSAVHVIDPDASGIEASRAMFDKHVGALVVRRPGGPVEGIVSERDVVLAIAARGAEAVGDTVRALMTPAERLVTCGAADPISHIMAVMTDRRVRHLPVMDGPRMIGLVSIGDLVKARIRETLAEVEAMKAYVSG